MKALRLSEFVAREAQNPHPCATHEFTRWIDQRKEHSMTEAKKSTTRTRKAPTKKPTAGTGATAATYATLEPKDKAAVLKALRDGEQLSWKAAGDRIGLSPTAYRAQYSKFVRPHTESVVFPGVGRKRNEVKRAEPARKATVKQDTSRKRQTAAVKTQASNVAAAKNTGEAPKARRVRKAESQDEAAAS